MEYIEYFIRGSNNSPVDYLGFSMSTILASANDAFQSLHLVVLFYYFFFYSLIALSRTSVTILNRRMDAGKIALPWVLRDFVYCPVKNRICAGFCQ